MTTTRWWPVLGLALLAPWSAELAWGGFPFTDVPLIVVFLAPLYGSAALLVREVARRTGRGWPCVLLLAAAFGVLQAGVVDQSLFNPDYGRYDFQEPAHVPGVDVSLYYLLAFVTGHVVASIGAPVALVEAWTRRPAEPWLSRRATWAVAGVYVLASVLNHVGVKADEGHGFQARPLQTLAAAATACALAAAALLWRRRPAPATRVPPPWVLATVGFTAYLLYLPGEGTASLLVGLAVVFVVVVAVGTWSRSGRWRPRHALALALGAFLTGVVAPFLNAPYDPSVGAGRERLDDLVAAAVCAAVVLATCWRLRVLARRARTPAVDPFPATSDDGGHASRPRGPAGA